MALITPTQFEEKLDQVILKSDAYITAAQAAIDAFNTNGGVVIPATSSATTGDVLTWNGTAVVWATPTGGTPLPSTTSTTAGYVLTYDGNDVVWAAPTGGGGDVTTAQLQAVRDIADQALNLAQTNATEINDLQAKADISPADWTSLMNKVAALETAQTNNATDEELAALRTDLETQINNIVANGAEELDSLTYDSETRTLTALSGQTILASVQLIFPTDNNDFVTTAGVMVNAGTSGKDAELQMILTRSSGTQVSVGDFNSVITNKFDARYLSNAKIKEGTTNILELTRANGQTVEVTLPSSGNSDPNSGLTETEVLALGRAALAISNTRNLEIEGDTTFTLHNSPTGDQISTSTATVTIPSASSGKTDTTRLIFTVLPIQRSGFAGVLNLKFGGFSRTIEQTDGYFDIPYNFGSTGGEKEITFTFTGSDDIVKISDLRVVVYETGAWHDAFHAFVQAVIAEYNFVSTSQLTSSISGLDGALRRDLVGRNSFNTLSNTVNTNTTGLTDLGIEVANETQARTNIDNSLDSRLSAIENAERALEAKVQDDEEALHTSITIEDPTAHSQTFTITVDGGTSHYGSGEFIDSATDADFFGFNYNAHPANESVTSFAYELNGTYYNEDRYKVLHYYDYTNNIDTPLDIGDISYNPNAHSPVLEQDPISRHLHFTISIRERGSDHRILASVNKQVAFATTAGGNPTEGTMDLGLNLGDDYLFGDIVPRTYYDGYKIEVAWNGTAHQPHYRIDIIPGPNDRNNGAAEIVVSNVYWSYTWDRSMENIPTQERIPNGLARKFSRVPFTDANFPGAYTYTYTFEKSGVTFTMRPRHLSTPPGSGQTIIEYFISFDFSSHGITPTLINVPHARHVVNNSPVGVPIKELPDYSASNADEVLSVGADGTLEWAEASYADKASTETRLSAVETLAQNNAASIQTLQENGLTDDDLTSIRADVVALQGAIASKADQATLDTLQANIETRLRDLENSEDNKLTSLTWDAVTSTLTATLEDESVVSVVIPQSGGSGVGVSLSIGENEMIQTRDGAFVWTSINNIYAGYFDLNNVFQSIELYSTTSDPNISTLVGSAYNKNTNKMFITAFIPGAGNQGNSLCALFKFDIQNRTLTRVGNEATWGLPLEVFTPNSQMNDHVNVASLEFLGNRLIGGVISRGGEVIEINTDDGTAVILGKLPVVHVDAFTFNPKYPDSLVYQRPISDLGVVPIVFGFFRFNPDDINPVKLGEIVGNDDIDLRANGLFYFNGSYYESNNTTTLFQINDETFELEESHTVPERFNSSTPIFDEAASIIINRSDYFGVAQDENSLRVSYQDNTLKLVADYDRIGLTSLPTSSGGETPTIPRPMKLPNVGATTTITEEQAATYNKATVVYTVSGRNDQDTFYLNDSEAQSLHAQNLDAAVTMSAGTGARTITFTSAMTPIAIYLEY